MKNLQIKRIRKGEVENNAYFQSLPKFIQESVKQCGAADITCEQDLRSLAENIMNQQ